MKKIVYIILILIQPVIFFSVSAQRVNGGFPFYRSFLDGRMDNVEKPVPNNPDANEYVDRSNKAVLVDNLGLQLTSLKSEVGAFYLPNHPFTTNDGLKIEFEYMMYPTPGFSGGITDGIAMFLVDANYINNLEYGAEGAGFGYTNRWAIDYYYTNARIKGIAGGYLAIALDQKNFKTTRMEGNELRNGIYYSNTTSSTISAKPTAHNTASNVTIRGAAGMSPRTITSRSSSGSTLKSYNLGAREWGYPLLATRHTGGIEDRLSYRNSAGYILNTSTGSFESGGFQAGSVMPRIEQPFDIAGGKIFEGPDEPEYRKAIIKLAPNTSGGGFKITVEIQHGNEVTPVIENFTFPATVSYLENGLPISVNGLNPTVAARPEVVTYQVAAPSNLVIGFTASTGTETHYTNVIKNLRITPLYGANTANDDITSHRRGPVRIKVLENDLGYMPDGDTSIGGSEYLDPTSFRFWTDEYTCLGAGVFEYTVTNEGHWVYDKETAEVLFFPRQGFVGETSIMYDIKGKIPPYNEEKFRSSLAIISVTIADNQP